MSNAGYHLALPKGVISIVAEGEAFGFVVTSSKGERLGANAKPYGNKAAALDGARRLARVLADLPGV